MLADGLNDRQRRFCEEYVIDYVGKRAAIAAGYEKPCAAATASQLIRRPDVIEYINYLKKQQQNRSKINADYVLGHIVETLERCSQEIEPVTRLGTHVTTSDKDGEQAKAYRFDAKNALKAAELLGKHLKLFTEVVDTNHSVVQMPTVTITSKGDGSQPDRTTEMTFDVGGDPDGQNG